NFLMLNIVNQLTNNSFNILVQFTRNGKYIEFEINTNQITDRGFFIVKFITVDGSPPSLGEDSVCIKTDVIFLKDTTQIQKYTQAKETMSAYKLTINDL